MRTWRRLASAIKVRNVDELICELKAGVCASILVVGEHMRKIAERRVAPIVQSGDLGARATLRVEQNVRHAEANEAREQTLLEIRVFLQSDVLDDRRQLMMVTDHNPALETIDALGGLLQQQRNERLHLENLRRLLHDHIIVAKAELDELAASKRSVCTRHCDHLCLANLQVSIELNGRSLASIISPANNQIARVRCAEAQRRETRRA